MPSCSCDEGGSKKKGDMTMTKTVQQRCRRAPNEKGHGHNNLQIGDVIEREEILEKAGKAHELQ